MHSPFELVRTSSTVEDVPTYPDRGLVRRAHMNPILVTGATGRIGRIVVDPLLAAGTPVRGTRSSNLCLFRNTSNNHPFVEVFPQALWLD